MDVYGIHIPNKALTNLELVEFARQLHIPDFRGVFMRDTLPTKPYEVVLGLEVTGSHTTKMEKIGFISIPMGK